MPPRTRTRIPPPRPKIGRPSASDSFEHAPVTLDTLSTAEQARFQLAMRQKGITDPAKAIADANAALVADPVGWVRTRLNEHPWSRQREIMESVRDNRYTMVPSCHGAGKALALSTPLATPTGWTTMGEIKVGDLLYDEAGQPTRVIAISGIENRESYLIVFSDGSSIAASDNHLWNAVDIRHRPRRVTDWRDHWESTKTLSTTEIARSIKSNGQPRWRVPSAQALASDLPWSLPHGPYTFGAWLGDGTRVRAEITSHRDDAEHIKEQIEHEETAVLFMEDAAKPNTVLLRFSHRPYIDAPSRYLAHGRKDIPREALRASYADRLRLLQGLMDTDGYLGKARGAECAITLTDETLSAAVHELIVSLGCIVRASSKPAMLYGKNCGTAYTLAFRPLFCPFTLPRKAVPWEKAHAAAAQRSRHTQRTIISVVPLGRRLVQCVEVDSPSHLYLAGTSLIPTHNSWLAARIAAWWLDSHAAGEAFVVTSAPTFRQVKAILWREMARAFAKGNLRGRMNTTEWYMPGAEGNEELVAFGNKPSDFSPTAFQGIHQRYVLVIFDEAGGIPKSLFDAASSLLTNEHCRLLAIGNPDDPTTEFAEMSKPGQGTHVIHISAFDTPNFTGEVIPERMRDLLVSPIWVNERKRKWGEDNPVYIAKVLGQFPETSEASLIPISAVKAAQARTLEPTYPNELGVDVGGGIDATVVCRRQGPVARIVLDTTNPDTMQTLGAVIRILKETGATVAKIDRIGIGHGACNRAEEVAKTKEPNARYAKLVRGVHVGQAARDKEQFANLRAEGFWLLRERFMDGDMDIDPNDDDLAAQLCDIRIKPNSRGQQLIESKEDMQKRGKSSPNRADALMLAYLDDRGKNRKATWGHGRATSSAPADIAREQEQHRVRRAHRRPIRRG